VSVIAVAADRDPPAAPAEPASGAHRATLERVFGLIYAVVMALMMAVFWSSSATLAGNRPGGMAADVLLSALLAGQTLRALRRPPSQRDLWLMAAATEALLLVSRVLAVPGSPFLGNNSDVLVIPVAAGRVVWSGRLAVPVPLLLVILASWTADPGVLAVEQAASALALIACTASAAVGLAAANTVLTAVAFLAVAPGTTDSLAYWAAGVSGIVVAAIYFTRGRYPAWPPWPSTWRR